MHSTNVAKTYIVFYQSKVSNLISNPQIFSTRDNREEAEIAFEKAKLLLKNQNNDELLSYFHSTHVCRILLSEYKNSDSGCQECGTIISEFKL